LGPKRVWSLGEIFRSNVSGVEGCWLRLEILQLILESTNETKLNPKKSLVPKPETYPNTKHETLTVSRRSLSTSRSKPGPTRRGIQYSTPPLLLRPTPRHNNARPKPHVNPEIPTPKAEPNTKVLHVEERNQYTGHTGREGERALCV
jgi:hypothetical protein